jgi:hypothetical protein
MARHMSFRVLCPQAVQGYTSRQCVSACGDSTTFLGFAARPGLTRATASARKTVHLLTLHLCVATSGCGLLTPRPALRAHSGEGASQPQLRLLAEAMPNEFVGTRRLEEVMIGNLKIL